MIHVQEIGKSGIISHDSLNMDVKQRLEYHGKGKVIATYGESLQFYYKEPADIMIQLLINDSGFTQGNFDNIFNPNFHVMSCFTG